MQALIRTGGSVHISTMARESQYLYHFTVGQALAGMGRFREAESELLRAVSIDANAAGAHQVLGKVYLAVSQMELAGQEFSKVLALVPDHTEAHYHMALVNSFKGNRFRAQRMLEKALEINPYMKKAKELLKQMR
jgi:tetratricopeptide (TPR) repeat protein